MTTELEHKLTSADKRISELESLYQSAVIEKQALQSQLIETQNHLSKTQQIGQTGSWEFNLEKNELFLSDEVFRIFGLIPATTPLTYQSFIEAVHPDDRSLVDFSFTESIKNTAKEYDIEHRIIKKSNGEIRYVHEKYIHSRDQSGKVINTSGVVFDVTDKVKSEIEKEYTEKKFLNIIEASPLPYALNDEEQNITYLNSAFTQVFGYDRSDIPTVADWWPKAYPDKEYRNWVIKTWAQHLEAAKNNNISFEPIEVNIHCKDNSIRTVLGSAASLTDSFEGTHLVILYDITERKKFEKELNKAVTLLENVVDSTPDLIIVKDLELKTIFCNQAFAKVVNKKRNDLYGKTDNENGWALDKADINKAEDSRSFIHQDDEALAGKVFHNNHDTAIIEGKTQIFDTHKLPLKDANDNIIGVLGVARDITDRKRTEEQLRQSQKMDALGKLTGGVAHDFNNMLGVILGYAELIELKLEHKSDLNKYIREIHTAGDRARALTSKLLSFSKNIPADAKSCQINAILLSNQDMLEKTLTAKIKLNMNLAESLWDVYIDEETLADSILNICINAMYAMPDGGELNISTQNICLKSSLSEPLNLSEGDYVQLSIQDNGCGMTKDIVEHIFEPFFSTKGEAGTGLGMSQVYGFVQQNKSGIQVTSTPAEGSEISIYFPRYMNSDVAASTQQLEKNNTNKQGNETILVVDDELALRELAKEILSIHGYNVVVAENTLDAIRILDSQPIDLLFSDVIMPEMDGYQLAVEARKRQPEIKIQLVSGYNDQHFINEVDEMLQNHQINKPYTARYLLDHIRQLLDEK